MTDEANERKVCRDCGCLSPKTETNYTLISSRFGWRLSRETDSSGEVQMVWRCPECWNARRRSHLPRP